MRIISSITTYLQGVSGEMRKVVWPSFPAMVRYFLSVVIGIVLATAFIGLVDFLFIRALTYIVK